MSMDVEATRSIIERLSTRLCHDMAGPLGAISNGMELLSELDEDMQDEAMELVQSSAQRAIHQLQFFRFVLGTAKYDGDADLPLCRQLSQQWLAARNITLDWPDESAHSLNLSISMPVAKAICVGVILAAQAILTQGTIYVSVVKHGDSRLVTVRAESERVQWKDAWSTALLSPASHGTGVAKTEIIDYAHVVLSSMQHHWEVHASDKQCELRLSCHQPDPGVHAI